MEGSGTLALTGDMKQMDRRFVRGVSFKGYGVSLSIGVGIPIPILSPEILKRTTVRDEEIFAPVIDYSDAYPNRKSDIIARVSYGELRTGKITIQGNEVRVGSLSSYSMALEVAEILAGEIRAGRFAVTPPITPLTTEQSMMPLEVRERNA